MNRCDNAEERDEWLLKSKTENPTYGRIMLCKLSVKAGLNIPESYVQRWLKKYAKAGGGTVASNIPEGFSVKGVSTLHGPGGEIKQQWVKTCREEENLLDVLTEAVTAIIEPCRRHAQPIMTPEVLDKDLLTTYPIADAHMGMYSWAEETGQDFDADLCEDNLISGMQYLVNASPPSETALIANIADFFHADTAENKTMRSGNVLDVDTRWARVLQIGVRCYRSMIMMALSRHKTVYVKSGIGNHDDHSILTLAMMMQAYFENEPRVIIELPISQFAYHTFGKNLIGITHMVKAERLPGIMACDKPVEWGVTQHRTWYEGHLHSKGFKEFPGCTVEQFRSPSPKDAWTAGMGYRSKQSMEAITYHKEHGEVSRVIKNI